MTNFEMVEMLREKANISYEEAKAALEQTNWDLLDAMVLLEKEGKVMSNETGGSYSTKSEEKKEPEEKHRGAEGLRSAVRWLGEKAGWLLRIGNTNHFVVSRGGKEKFSLPVTVCVILLLCAFWLVLAALVIGLFCGVRYSFRGAELGRTAINDAMERAADAADNMKEDFRNSASRPGAASDDGASSANTGAAGDDDIYGQEKDGGEAK